MDLSISIYNCKAISLIINQFNIEIKITQIISWRPNKIKL